MRTSQGSVILHFAHRLIDIFHRVLHDALICRPRKEERSKYQQQIYGSNEEDQSYCEMRRLALEESDQRIARLRAVVSLFFIFICRYIFFIWQF